MRFVVVNYFNIYSVEHFTVLFLRICTFNFKAFTKIIKDEVCNVSKKNYCFESTCEIEATYELHSDNEINVSAVQTQLFKLESGQ